MSGTKRTRASETLAAEFRAQDAKIEVERLSRELARLRGAAIDVLHALPEDKAPALRRLRLEMAARGNRSAA